MRDETEDKARRPATHQIGEKLDDLSVAELEDRMALLKAEIVRLDAARTLKQGALRQASAIFKS